MTSMSNPQFQSQHVPEINTLAPNRVAVFEGFHLSYNNRSADYGSDTTALVFEDTLFFILNGDHGSALLAAAQTEGKQGCIDYFIENAAQANHRSEHHWVLKGDNTFNIADTGMRVLGSDNLERLRQASA